MTSRFLLSGAGLLVLAATVACGDAGDGGERTAAPAPLVEALAARSGALPIEETVPGVVRARNQVAIRPETAGRIVEVPARIGESVERGRLLVRLDDSEARERLRQAEADVRLAEAGAVAARARASEVETRVARERILAEQELVSAQQIESLEAELDAARASADEAVARVELRRAAAEESRSALAKTEIRSPVAGRLGERRAEVGMQVDPSTVLFLAGDFDELIVEVNLTESMLARVDEGLPVVIETRTPGNEPIRASLSRISPFLAEQSFTALGEIDVENRAGETGSGSRLRPGMFVTARILVGESRTATLVPISALWENPETGVRGVFLIPEAADLDASPEAPGSAMESERAAMFRPVEVLAEGRGVAGVTGVEEGDWVVIVGQHLLGGELRAAASNDGAGETTTAARVRPVSWERILELQDLQDEDLLEGFLDKQRKVAAAIGAEIPESEDVVDRVLEQAASESAPPGAY